MSGIERYSNAEGAYTVVDGVSFTKGWDKYGRTCQFVQSASNRVAVGMIVRLPKVAIARQPGRVYLTNDWTLSYEQKQADAERGVQYHKTLTEAKARMLAIGTRVAA